VHSPLFTILIVMRVYAENPRLGLILEKCGLRDHDIRMDEDEWLRAENSLVVIESATNPLLANLLRMSISHVDRGIKIAILKEEWKDGEEEKIDRFIRGEYSRIHLQTQNAMKNAKSLCDGKWKEERIEELTSTRTIPMIQYSTFTVSSVVREDINRYLNDVHVTDESEYEKTHKPPNLHWTPSVLEGDLEITLRFRFFICLPDREVITCLTKEASSYYSNVYEWNDGVLLSNDIGKVHIQRINENTLNISGRICYEEVEDVSSACSLLWPMLAFAAKRILLSLSNNQFHCDLVLIGSPLFMNIPHGNESQVDNRVFDLYAFFCTAARCGKVGFKYRGEVEMVNLRVLFPCGIPSSLLDLLSYSSSLPSIAIAPPSPTPLSLSLPTTH
ncbi:hypothetical protein PMAYCL1PPCAC_18286, partial [Pristionchus mayeri]